MKTLRIFFFAILIVLVCFASCNQWEGKIGVCDNIKDAKKRDVFVERLTVDNNPYLINDTLALNIIEAWIENRWSYSSDYDVSKKGEGYSLRMNVNENQLSGIMEKWCIGIDYKKCFRRCGKSSLMADFDEVPIGDTIVFKVQSGCSIFGGKEPVIIGEIVLNRDTIFQ